MFHSVDGAAVGADGAGDALGRGDDGSTVGDAVAVGAGV